MTDMKDNAIPFGKTAEEIIQEHVAEYDFPVAYQFPSGHFEDNRAVFIGKNAHVNVERTSSLFKQ